MKNPKKIICENLCNLRTWYYSKAFVPGTGTKNLLRCFPLPPLFQTRPLLDSCKK